MSSFKLGCMLHALAILSCVRGSFGYMNRRLPSSRIVPCTLLLLRAASGGPGLPAPPPGPARSKIKATHTDVPIILYHDPAPLKKHHESHSSPATGTTSRRHVMKHVPRVCSHSPASIDPGFVEIGLVQLTQSVKTTNVTHTHTDRQTD